jgi:hypothetical protein
MASRHCGYCRLDGHRADKCPTKKEHRTISLSHTPKERLYLLDILTKNGLGLGATFLMNPYYSSDPAVITIVDAEWVSELQFVSAKRVKYSKQVNLGCKQSFERIGDVITNPSDQYGTFVIKAFIVHDGTASMAHVHIGYRKLLLAIRDESGSTDTGQGKIVIINKSYQPYENLDDVITRNVKLHKRLATDEEMAHMSHWSDDAWIRGILPVEIS